MTQRKGFIFKAIAVTGVVVMYAALLSVAFAEHGDATLNAEPEITRAPEDTKVHIKASLNQPAPSDRPVNIDAEIQDAKTPGPGPGGGSGDVGVTSADSPNDPDPTPASPNLPDFTCSIPAGEQWCWFDYVGDAEIAPSGTGTDEICVWIDEDFDDQTTEGDCDEFRDDTRQDRSGGGDECNDPESGDATPPFGEPDCTDVVHVIWSDSSTEANSLDCDDSLGPDREKETNTNDQSETYTCRLRDSQGARGPEGTIYAEVENGVNDPDATDDDSYDSPDYFCVANNSGDNESDCTITVTQAEGEAGTAEICFWSYPAGQTVASDSELCGDEEVDEGQTSTQLTDVGNDMADRVELTWSATSTRNTTTTATTTSGTTTSTQTTSSTTTSGMTTPPGQSETTTTTTTDGQETQKVATTLTINYRRGLFSGSVGSSKKRCQVGRAVKLKQHVPGRNKVRGRDKSNRSGNWKVRPRRVRKGRYYAVVAKKVFTNNKGVRVVCRWDKSPTTRAR